MVNFYFKGNVRIRRICQLACVLIGLALTAGCVHRRGGSTSVNPEQPQSEDSERLETARELYESGDYNAAVLACLEVAHEYPETPGLDELQEKAMEALLDRRGERLRRTRERDRRLMATDIREKASLPDTYALRGALKPLPEVALGAEGPMEEVLSRPVDIHLQGARLSGFIEALAEDAGVNIIADKALGGDQTLDISVEQVPLREILDYVRRNMGVEFYVGRNMIWAAAAGAPQAAPLETRIYPLRKGLLYQGDDWGDPPDRKPHDSDLSALTHKATVVSSRKSYIEEVLAKFVPETEGARIHLDRNQHTLFVRDTRENLDLISRIVQALDATPPQVLIEARFIEISLSDLRELGLEWSLNTPWVTTSKRVLEEGVWSRRPRTQVDSASMEYTPFTTGAGGPHPLGPQGAFGIEGNPPTDTQGLNVGFSGILTQPQFEAVLHALEISGKGRTLSVPRVTTVNNNPAKLRDGEDLQYFEEFQAQAFHLVDQGEKYTVTVLIPKGRPVVEELGITLVAVPSVGADRDTISLLLHPSLSSLEGFLSYQDESVPADPIRQVVVKLPRVSRREVQTKVMVESGETVVLGGLIDSIEQETEYRVPLLGSLPLLGPLFRRTEMTEENQSLLIFVTATVISERGESLLTRYPGGMEHRQNELLLGGQTASAELESVTGEAADAGPELGGDDD